MKTWLPYALTGLVSFIVGFILGLLTHFLALRKDRGDRMREFRNILVVLLDKFKTAPNTDLIFIHRESAAKLKQDGARILEDIRFWRRARFNQACAAYWRLSEQDIRNYDPSHIAYELFKGSADNPPPKQKSIENYDLGRKRILTTLTELHRLSW